MTEWLVVVTDVSGSFFGRLFETQRAGADRDPIAVLELLLKARLTVDENLVRAAPELTVDYGAVDDRECAVLGLIDVSVITRSTRIIQHHCVVGRAANR